MAYVELLTPRHSGKELTTLVWRAYRQCHSHSAAFLLSPPEYPADMTDFILACMRRGHLSPLEHAQLTFCIEDITRVASHQLVRHRIASYSQQSLRHTRTAYNPMLYPASVRNWLNQNPHSVADLCRAFEIYDAMIGAGVPVEDARCILPMGVASSMVVTMNLRSLLHFFNERLCASTQDELRDIAGQMARLTLVVFPWLDAFIGPKCLRTDHCLDTDTPDTPVCEEHYLWRDAPETCPEAEDSARA